VEKEEREWCAGLPAAVFWPWVRRTVEALDPEGAAAGAEGRAEERAAAGHGEAAGAGPAPAAAAAAAGPRLAPPPSIRCARACAVAGGRQECAARAPPPCALPPPHTHTNTHKHPHKFPHFPRVLDAELEPLLLSKAAQFNLPGDWCGGLGSGLGALRALPGRPIRVCMQGCF
jgi:hypothetical protein